MKRVKFSFVLIVFFLNYCQVMFATAAPKESTTKGMFTIQFSWNSDSYSKKVMVEVEYKKKGFLTKKKASGTTAFQARKNQFITLSLSEGTYELYAVHLTGPEFGYNKYLKIPLSGSFEIRPGEVSNGGLIYLIRENKTSNNIMALRIKNTSDVYNYISTYKHEYSGDKPIIKPAWNFLENKKVDKLVASFAELLVRRESARKRPKVTHLYATLGTVLKMTKDKEGTVTNYQMIQTPTYQQIKSMQLKKDGTIICHLENGGFLYGTDKQLDYMPLPKKLAGAPEFQMIKNNRFLLVDSKFNIYSTDTSFNWKAQTNYSMDLKPPGFFSLWTLPVYPKIYTGKQHLYIYSPTDDKRKVLLQSDYNTINFKSITLSNEVKKITRIYETPTHIIIGPILKLSATAKRPAYLYFKEHSQSDWVVRNLPRGDCKRFFPGKDPSILYTECSKSNWYESVDYGVTWSQWKPNK